VLVSTKYHVLVSGLCTNLLRDLAALDFGPMGTSSTGATSDSSLCKHSSIASSSCSSV
jgi:hypothetical protein